MQRRPPPFAAEAPLWGKLARPDLSIPCQIFVPDISGLVSTEATGPPLERIGGMQMANDVSLPIQSQILTDNLECY